MDESKLASSLTSNPSTLGMGSPHNRVETIDWGDESDEVVCGIENPESCESCT